MTTRGAIAALVALSSLLAAAAAPDFCRGYPCPPFDEIEGDSGAGFTLRKYAKAKWVGINEGEKYAKSYRSGYAKLYSYMSGANKDGESIDMTTPVLTMLLPKKDGGFEKNFTISFYLPERFQEDPPTPNEREVHVVEIPEFNVYVYEYGGFTNEKDIEAKAALLFKALKDNDKKVKSSAYVAATYDNPLRVIDRHNEIWMFAKDADDEAELDLGALTAIVASGAQSVIHEVSALGRKAGVV